VRKRSAVQRCASAQAVISHAILGLDRSPFLKWGSKRGARRSLYHIWW